MTGVRYIDFHCHLDLYPDLLAAINESVREQIFSLAVTTTPKAWPRNYALTKETRYVRAALGLHPQVIGERAHEIALWERYLPEARYVGEVGLDAGPKFYRSFESQTRIFTRILCCCAEIGGKILTIHSVRATAKVLSLLELYLPQDRGTAVLHWFTGTQSEARRAVELGCFFSINAEMLRDERRRALIRALPCDRLLTETDGPFTQVGGRPSRPADVRLTLEALALCRGVSTETITETISTNFRTLIGKDSIAV